jgi:formiminotetrahydrofolate cyclodeaminase
MAIARETFSGLLGRSVGDTLEDVSHRDTPAAGGTSAGLVGALGAALTSMAARSARSTWIGAGGAIAQAEALRTRLCALTARDTEVYVQARALLLHAEREGGAAETATYAETSAAERRDYDLAGALDSAASVPLAIAETAADVAALAAWAAEEVDSSERADAIVGAILAEAAAGGAAQLVLVNLAVQPQDELAVRANAAALAAAESRRRASACAC